jgi:hypothetical protein
MICHVCGQAAVGQCVSCLRFYCRLHGDRTCSACAGQGEAIRAEPPPSRLAALLAPPGPAAPCVACHRPTRETCSRCERPCCPRHRRRGRCRRCRRRARLPLRLAAYLLLAAAATLFGVGMSYQSPQAVQAGAVLLVAGSICLALAQA